MWISKAAVVVLALLQFLEVEICDSKDSSVALLPNGNLGASSNRNHHMIQSNSGGKARCNKRSCNRKNGGHKPARQERKRKKRALCKKTFVKCKLRKFGQCKNRKCIKKSLKKCKKSFRKCKKDSNRRPKPGNPGKVAPTVTKNRLPIANGSSTVASVKIEANEICKETSDCAEGLCCAKHGHVKICKSYMILGQICPRPYKKKRSPDRFEQCPCQAGLSCSKSKSRHHTCQLMYT